uniref:Protein argonaute N-terminal domain-containing protein n=1 Tax=Chromera velia CCMP2878 TaxID=1169474 RepID=A0A0G4I1I9_9ALVE|eukprot:Cvel_10150.t1-p1 / transcript=Cvel_10150.t1 / gene=Cvel_10150 / organism=Chromera_velia_CCMP2878 / gene_product=hypothetical protein / transcript_product=hypothetical protein / location=Cvel_scaffold605:48963-51013(-) / protein_length=472 / sequence_SO=supercontig / SO=protein_coding / is_pseudo=false
MANPETWRRVPLEVNYFPIQPSADLKLYRYEVIFQQPDWSKKIKEQRLARFLKIKGRPDLLAGFDGHSFIISVGEVDSSIIEIGDDVTMLSSPQELDIHRVFLRDTSTADKEAILDAVNVILKGAVLFKRRDTPHVSAVVDCLQRGRFFFPKDPSFLFPINQYMPPDALPLGTYGWRRFSASVGLTGRAGTETPQLTLCVNVSVGLAFEPRMSLRGFLERTVLQGPLILQADQQTLLEQEQKINNHPMVRRLHLRCRGKRREYTFGRLHLCDPGKRAGTHFFLNHEGEEVSVSQHFASMVERGELTGEQRPEGPVPDDDPLMEAPAVGQLTPMIPLSCCFEVEPFQIPDRDKTKEEEEALQQEGLVVPEVRRQKILDVVKKLYGEDNSVLGHFGLTVGFAMTRVEGRVMPVPPIQMERKEQSGVPPQAQQQQQQRQGGEWVCRSETASGGLTRTCVQNRLSRRSSGNDCRGV